MWCKMEHPIGGGGSVCNDLGGVSTVDEVREAIIKRLSFGHCPKGGGAKPESKSFEVV